MHVFLIDEFGGSAGIRDEGALAAAVMRPQLGYYGSLTEEAAALMESLAVNHPFVDGNKRVAFFVTDVFLRENGHFIDCDDRACPRVLHEAVRDQRVPVRRAGELARRPGEAPPARLTVGVSCPPRSLRPQVGAAGGSIPGPPITGLSEPLDWHQIMVRTRCDLWACAARSAPYGRQRAIGGCAARFRSGTDEGTYGSSWRNHGGLLPPCAAHNLARNDGVAVVGLETNHRAPDVGGAREMLSAPLARRLPARCRISRPCCRQLLNRTICVVTTAAAANVPATANSRWCSGSREFHSAIR